MLESDMAKLFESNQQVTNIGTQDVQILWHDALFLQYEQFRLSSSFREYLQSSLMPKMCCEQASKRIPCKNFTSCQQHAKPIRLNIQRQINTLAGLKSLCSTARKTNTQLFTTPITQKLHRLLYRACLQKTSQRRTVWLMNQNQMLVTR